MYNNIILYIVRDTSSLRRRRRYNSNNDTDEQSSHRTLAKLGHQLRNMAKSSDRRRRRPVVISDRPADLLIIS